MAFVVFLATHVRLLIALLTGKMVLVNSETTNFWHKVWLEAGSPSSGVLFHIKRRAKSRYKYAVRRLKRRHHFILREKSLLLGKEKMTFGLKSRDLINRHAPPMPLLLMAIMIARILLPCLLLISVIS